MRVAIEKVCAQLPEEMLLDVSTSISSRCESLLNRTATSLSTYVNSSMCEYSEVAQVSFILLKVNLIYFCILFPTNSLNVYSFSCINLFTSQDQ